MVRISRTLLLRYIFPRARASRVFDDVDPIPRGDANRTAALVLIFGR